MDNFIILLKRTVG